MYYLLDKNRNPFPVILEEMAEKFESSNKERIIKKTSYFIEFWRTPESYQKSLDNNKVRVKKFAINNPNKMTEKR